MRFLPSLKAARSLFTILRIAFDVIAVRFTGVGLILRDFGGGIFFFVCTKKKMYKLGKITLSRPALSAFVIGILMFVTTLIAFRGSKKGITIALAYLLMTFYNTYMINCLIVGQCKELAWVLVGLMSIAVLLTVGSLYKLGKLV